ncbi:MAG TPA: YciI family protein [Gemmatimonadaceae bacterium]|jgi:hypothetical protein
MRFMSIYTPDPSLDENVPPRAEEIAKVDALIKEMSAAGVLLVTEGLKPSSTGARLEYKNEKVVVVDGPFTESKELVGGYAIIQVNSKAEAIEWVKRFLGVMGGGKAEVREMHECSDFEHVE